MSLSRRGFRFAGQTMASLVQDDQVAYGMRLHVTFPNGDATELAARNRYTAVGPSSEWPLLADSIRTNGATGNATVMNAFPNQVFDISGWGQATHLRHNNTANVLYIDGHAEPVSHGQLQRFPARHGNFLLTIVDKDGRGMTAWPPLTNQVGSTGRTKPGSTPAGKTGDRRSPGA